MRIISTVFILSFLASQASAACGDTDTLLMSCTFSNGDNQMEICLSDPNVTYNFGNPNHMGEPLISVPIQDIDYMPWPGISNFFEVFTFPFGDLSLVIGAGETRVHPDNEQDDMMIYTWGSLEVIQGWTGPGPEAVLVSLECDALTTFYPYSRALTDAKRQIGQCWQQRDQLWGACDD